MIQIAEQLVARQPAISFSVSFQHPVNRAGRRTSNVLHKMKTILILLALASSVAMAQGQFPRSIEPGMPSLEKAYEGRMEITRYAPTPQGIVGYYVKIFDPEVIAIGRSSKLCTVILAVSNALGKELAWVEVDFSGSSTQPPSKEPFCCFSFNIHESCEKYSVVSLGSHDGMRNHYVGYKLPEKSISRKMGAEQAGADQPAIKPADKISAKDKPSTPTSKVVPR